MQSRREEFEWKACGSFRWWWRASAFASSRGASGGEPSIGARCVDAIKNSDGEPLIRSLLAARDFCDKGDKGEDLFARSPPVDILKPMLALSFREGPAVTVADVNTAQLIGGVKPEDGGHNVHVAESGVRRAST